MTGPSKEEALQFAIMLQAGLPAGDAILYFIDSTDPAEIAGVLNTWLRSRVVKEAQRTLLGKSWQEMDLNEKIKTALDYTYAGYAYFLFTRNYSEVGPADKAKLDTARQALEAKIAGTAGKNDPLSQFFEDLRARRITIPTQPKAS